MRKLIALALVAGLASLGCTGASTTPTGTSAGLRGKKDRPAPPPLEGFTKPDPSKAFDPKKFNAKKGETEKDDAKKDEVKKDDAKKDEAKKDDAKKDEVKKDEVKKDEAKKDK
jgi:hypothetical protein